MQVTKLEEAGKNRFFLYLDDRYFATVDKAICKTFDLSAGKEINEEAVLRLLEDALVRKARERALHLLDQQPYTRKNLREKVSRTNDPVYTDMALDQLEQAGLLDDFAYGCALAQELISTKFASNRQIAEALYKRGVAKEAADRVKECLPADETKRVQALLMRKLAAEREVPDAKKLLGMLCRKGYQMTAVKEGIRRALGAVEEEI